MQVTRQGSSSEEEESVPRLWQRVQDIAARVDAVRAAPKLAKAWERVQVKVAEVLLLLETDEADDGEARRGYWKAQLAKMAEAVSGGRARIGSLEVR